MVQPRGVVLVWRHAGSFDISPLLKTTLRCNNGDDDDESYHDDVSQMRWAQSVDPARAPHHRGAHVSDGHRQRACGETERWSQIRSVDVRAGRTHTHTHMAGRWVCVGRRRRASTVKKGITKREEDYSSHSSESPSLEHLFLTSQSSNHPLFTVTLLHQLTFTCPFISHPEHIHCIVHITDEAVCI